LPPARQKAILNRSIFVPRAARSHVTKTKEEKYGQNNPPMRDDVVLASLAAHRVRDGGRSDGRFVQHDGEFRGVFRRSFKK
jgi:hypothetical protein